MRERIPTAHRRAYACAAKGRVVFYGHRRHGVAAGHEGEQVAVARILHVKRNAAGSDRGGGHRCGRGEAGYHFAFSHNGGANGSSTAVGVHQGISAARKVFGVIIDRVGRASVGLVNVGNNFVRIVHGERRGILAAVCKRKARNRERLYVHFRSGRHVHYIGVGDSDFNAPLHHDILDGHGVGVELHIVRVKYAVCGDVREIGHLARNRILSFKPAHKLEPFVGFRSRLNSRIAAEDGLRTQCGPVFIFKCNGKTLPGVYRGNLDVRRVGLSSEQRVARKVYNAAPQLLRDCGDGLSQHQDGD